MRSLENFKGYREIFTDARVLPPFFETNLVDPARVVKVFENDPQAEIRIFYYQYLKLCFELQNVNYDLYIRKVEEIINNPSFEFIFRATDDPSVFNDTQAKSLIMEFFGVLGEGSASVLESLKKYPIMDTILVHFFRSLMILSNVTDSLDSYLERDELLDFLCKTFEVEAEIHGECIRYIETDIFIYEANKNAVYMAYMDYEAYNNSIENSPQVNQSVQEPTYSQQPANGFVPTQVAQAPDSKRESLAKDSYIASEFVDFTSNADALTAKAKVTLKSSGMDQQVVQPMVQPVIQPKIEPKIVQPVVQPKIEPKVVQPEPKPSPVVVKQAPKQVNIDAKSTVSNAYNNINSNIYDAKSVLSYERPAEIKPQPKINPIQTSPTQNFYQSQSQVQQVQSQYSVQSNKYSSYQPPEPALHPMKSTPQPLPKDNNFGSPQLNASNSYKQQKNDIFYNPKIQSPNFNAASLLKSKPQEPIRDVKSTTTVGPSKKKPFGLNVSQEFTSPEVSRYLAEPHRSNVQAMKTRARNFRSSLSSLIK